MTTRIYLSNISKGWPVERQRELLGHRGAAYEDVVNKAALKKRNPESLKIRATLLRPTGRRTPETIRVASLVCLAWNWLDLSHVLAAAAARHATIVAADTGLEIPPVPETIVIDRAMSAFASGKVLAQTEPGRVIGRAAAAERKMQDTKRRIALIAADWPRAEHTTDELLRRAGIGKKRMAPATAKTHLGSRPRAQALYASKGGK